MARADASGIRFDWLTFDEGYGSCPEFLAIPNEGGHRFVAEIPVSFRVCRTAEGEPVRADLLLPGIRARYSFDRATTAPQRWRAASERVWVRGRELLLIVAVSETTAEVKYYLTDASDCIPERILRVAFRRATVGHAFRVAKSEAGLSHFEGRHYVGLMRHTTPTPIVLGFVSVHADLLRGEKPAGDDGACVARSTSGQRPCFAATGECDRCNKSDRRSDTDSVETKMPHNRTKRSGSRPSYNLIL